MPVKKTTRVDARAEKTVRLKKPVARMTAFGPKATLIVAGCVMAGGILIAARQQSPAVLTTTPRQEMAMMPEAHAKSLPPSNVPAMPATGATSVAEDAAGDDHRLPRARRRRLPAEGHVGHRRAAIAQLEARRSEEGIGGDRRRRLSR